MNMDGINDESQNIRKCIIYIKKKKQTNNKNVNE